MTDVLKSSIESLFDEHSDEFLAIRRHIHRYPELSFSEFETQAFIKSKLNNWNIDNYNIADTGVVAVVRGKNPDKKLIVLRADIDALPITENTGLDFSSQNNGVMHACGHDVHSTCVLAAGRILYRLKDTFEGSVKLLFQPGEEKLPGGATKVIASGELDNPVPDLIIGQHVFAEMESGMLGFRPGLYMASADEIYIDVKGPGGHAAMPSKTIDVVRIASELIISLKDFVDESALDSIPVILTFGKIDGKGATNIIPKLVHIEGTFRTLDEEKRKEMHKGMEKIVVDLTEKSGAQIELEIRKGYPCLKNNEEATEFSKIEAINFLGKGKVDDLDLRMTSEDFAFYSQKYKSCFYRLGVRTAGKEITNLHTPEFMVDESAIKTGSTFMAYLAMKFLKQN